MEWGGETQQHRSSLADLLRTNEQRNGVHREESGGQATPAASEAEPLPRPGDPYKAHSRADNKPAMTLHLLLRDGNTRGFAWGNFDSLDYQAGENPQDGPLLVLRFAGLMAVEVRIFGRNLGQLHAYLAQGRIHWIRELAGPDFGEQGTVITRLVIQPAEPVRW